MENGSEERGEIEEETREESKEPTDSQVSNGNSKEVNPLRLARPLVKGPTATKSGTSMQTGYVYKKEEQSTAIDPLEMTTPSEETANDAVQIDKNKTNMPKKEDKKPTSKSVAKTNASEKKPTDNVTQKKIQAKDKVEEPKPTENNSNEGSARTKRSRAPRNVYEAPDPEMDQILKSIKKMEADGDVPNNITETEETEETESVVIPEKEVAEKKIPEKKVVEKKITKSVTEKNRKKKRTISISDEEEEEEKDEDEDEDNDEDEYAPEPVEKLKKRKKEEEEDEDEYVPDKPVKKKKKKQTATTTKKNTRKKEPVFFKDEHLAVRNEGSGFYICRAKQNIFLGSRGINIQWWSNEEDVVPAKDNPEKNIYAADFYDKTDFETILTSVELSRRTDKGRGLVMPQSELERINKILKRAKEKAAGTLSIDNMDLTEDNPDGLDISLYKGEDQLDEIDRRRKGEISKKKEKVVDESSDSKTPVNVKKKEQEKLAKNEATPQDNVPKSKIAVKKSVEKTATISQNKKIKEIKITSDSEVKKVDPIIEVNPLNIANKNIEKKMNKKETTSLLVKEKEEKVTEKVTIAKVEERNKSGKRQASKNISYTQFDFLEDDDDEVMPSPKRRTKEKPEKETNSEEDTDESNEFKDNEREKSPAISKEILSTSERALLAANVEAELPSEEKEKGEEIEVESVEEDDQTKSQPVKKRGRKAKPKE